MISRYGCIKLKWWLSFEKILEPCNSSEGVKNIRLFFNLSCECFKELRKANFLRLAISIRWMLCYDTISCWLILLLIFVSSTCMA